MHGKGVFTWSDGRRFLIYLDMKENMLMTRNKDTENSPGLMERYIR